MRRLARYAALLLVGAWTSLAAAAGPPISVSAQIKAGAGAGVPAVDTGAVWVPLTKEGSVIRVDPARKRVVTRIKLGTPPRFTGYLDSAVAGGGSIWVARDVGDEVDRIDPRTNRLVARIKVDSRPGGLAEGGGYVWAFHFLNPALTRIDETTGAKTVFTIPKALGTGIAYADGAVWLLTAQPSMLVKIDPATGHVLASVAVTPRSTAKHGLVDTWWVAAGEGSLWAVNANYDRVTRVDAASGKVVASIPVPLEIPFGIVVRDGSVWVAGASRLARVDPKTNRVTGTVVLSKTSAAVFTQVASGPAGLWATDYDTGLLYRIRTP